MLLLDTSVCIDIMRRRRGGIAAHLQVIADETLVLSSIVLAELEFGQALTLQPDRGRVQIDDLLARCELHLFDATAANRYGRLRFHLRQSGTEIGPMDLLIAAHALALGAKLMTGNVREFQRVPGLEVIPLPSS